MRKFEKISFEQFKQDVCDDRELYESIVLPTRSTKLSAAYDIRSANDGIIHPGETCVFSTGLKVAMNDDEVFNLYSRSSLGYKYDVCLVNSVGVIDKDYYGNLDNDGHIMVMFYNMGSESVTIHKGDAIAQGIFQKYLITDNDTACGERIGGFGSTSK